MTGLVETALVPYLGLQIGELSLDEKAEILFVDQAYASVSLVLCQVIIVLLFSRVASRWTVRQHAAGKLNDCNLTI